MLKRILSHAAIMATFVFVTGCSPTGPAASSSSKATTASSKPVDDHSGWWCPEHGVPEEVCGLCDPKVGAEMKKKGDWCQEHDCPKSQCFTCSPELESKFIAMYEAKFGTKPPAR